MYSSLYKLYIYINPKLFVLIEDITDYVHKDTRQDGDFNIILCELEKVKKKKKQSQWHRAIFIVEPCCILYAFHFVLASI